VAFFLPCTGDNEREWGRYDRRVAIMSSVDTSLPDEIASVTDETDERLSKDVIFELLKNRRRREVLAYLLDADETVTLGELAEQIAAWENDTDINALSSDRGNVSMLPSIRPIFRRWTTLVSSSTTKTEG